jgi:hypothetical protein
VVKWDVDAEKAESVVTIAIVPKIVILIFPFFFVVISLLGYSAKGIHRLDGGSFIEVGSGVKEDSRVEQGAHRKVRVPKYHFGVDLEIQALVVCEFHDVPAVALFVGVEFSDSGGELRATLEYDEL